MTENEYAEEHDAARLTDEQDDALSAINDAWGVASWKRDEDGVLQVELDDGDTGTIEPDGSNTWGK